MEGQENKIENNHECGHEQNERILIKMDMTVGVGHLVGFQHSPLTVNRHYRSKIDWKCGSMRRDKEN